MKPANPPAKKSAGRPTEVPGGAVVTMNIRLSEAQKAKVEANGGASWVRKLIDRAKPPK